jgi:D,D-heptose 1,7-bisphosphate phosphatase
MINQVVILCGGRGTRLDSLTQATPKPMLLFGGRPFLDHLIHEYSRYPIDEIVLLAGFCGEQIHEAYHGNVFNGVKISVVIEKKLLGTLGAVLAAIEVLEDEFLLLNGDSYVEFDFWKLHTFWEKIEKVASAAMVVGRVENCHRYGKVEVCEDRIVSLNEKGSGLSEGLINLGIYIVRKESLKSYLTSKPIELSLEKIYFPDVISKNKLFHIEVYDHAFIDFGIPRDLEKLQLKMKNPPPFKAAFFDRDNTINIDNGYTFRTSDLNLCINIPDIIRSFSDRNYKIFIVSNQSGVAREYYTEEDVWRFHRELKKRLSIYGVFIDDFRFCPHHPTEGMESHVKNCDCRKPSNGMVVDLDNYWDIDLKKSVFVGDSDVDQICAEQSGVDFIRATCFNQNSAFKAYFKNVDNQKESNARHIRN